uniref:Voltage-dependent calcium channel subunit alpha-2/delta-1-like n=1 Tax=Saccoglossus kowalevskii TaxID=10224 RepID=A0ABM0MLB2_SACKO|nr:PREDICTED: voltage-dependent calcium channel subunit alpha-2/delta-1-like [Saccoglossus kowalevskii]
MAMLSTYRVLLLVLLFSKTEAFVHPRPAVVNEWSARIGLWLTEHILNNASGIEYLTERYKSENIPLVPVHGEQIVTEIADNWENLLGKKMTALEHLVRHLEEECLVYKYDPDITPDDVEYHPAKNVDLTLANSTKFGQPVNTTASVVHIPTDIFTGDPRILNGIKWTSKLDEVYISNYKEDPSLIWQYFGSAEGYMRTYPAHNWSLGPLMIDEYDVRRRTWYIQAAASPKDMMILIDVSGSVHGLVLELIKASAVSLIDTLGENDFVNIASFNERARFVSCFETFVQANERNKNVMKDKIRLLVDNGIASFDIGFTFAFEQFKKFKETSAFQEENQGANCSQVIMLLTDGGEQRAEEVFRNYNLPIETRVFTYVVGPQVTSSGGVKYMACENEGYFSRIPAVGAIRLNTLNYVRVLSRPMALERARVYQWSNIYLDAMGLGMMTTVTLPVYNRTTPENQQLLGVTGTDVTIADMEELIPEYKLGPASYAFGINTNGYILIHPRLKGQLGYLIEPPNVDLLEVELPTAEKEQLRKAMIDGKNGTIVTETLHRNTNELLFERYVFLINMTYWYRFINSTSFSMAIALPSFNLWSMDLNNRSFNEFQTKDQLHSDDCYILIAPWMFCPDQKHNATAEVVDSFISDFLENHNNSDCDHEMLTRLLIDLYATEDLEQNYWVAKFPGQGNDSLASLIELGVESLIVGTMGGLTRIYPKTVALELSDVELDNLRDPWKQDYYERALYINDYVISVPHNSGRNRDDNYTTVVSASKAVRLEKDVMPAVIKVTLQQEFFNMGWKEQTDKHLNCYLLDNGGFVVASNQEEHVSYVSAIMDCGIAYVHKCACVLLYRCFFNLVNIFTGILFFL